MGYRWMVHREEQMMKTCLELLKITAMVVGLLGVGLLGLVILNSLLVLTI